jgi:hypothetical protein
MASTLNPAPKTHSTNLVIGWPFFDLPLSLPTQEMVNQRQGSGSKKMNAI